MTAEEFYREQSGWDAGEHLATQHIEPDDLFNLMQAYADHVQEGKWISVSDSLPEAMPDDHQSELVLVTDTKEAIRQTMQDVTYYDHRHNCWDNTRWVGKITHWQPLPLPPPK